MTHRPACGVEVGNATTLCRVDVNGYDEPLFVWTNFENDLLSVKVSDGACTWQGSLCVEQLKVFS